jgi:prophage maintenance system killer protein
MLNGRDIEAPQKDKYITFLSLAEGSLTEKSLAGWIRDHLISA